MTWSRKYEFVQCINLLNGMYILVCATYDHIDIYTYKEIQRPFRCYFKLKTVKLSG